MNSSIHALIDSSKRKEKSVQKLKNFLMAEIKNSVGVLVKKVALRLQKVAVVDSTLTIMVTSVVAAMHLLKMAEEIRLLGLVVSCRLAEKGVPVPEGIAKLFAPVIVQEKEAQPTTQQSVAPAKKVPPAPPTAPARKIETVLMESHEEKRKKLFEILQSFISGKMINVPETVGFVASVVSASTDFSTEQWQIMLDAVKKNSQAHLPLFKREVATKIFNVAPIEMLSDAVFGQDGLFVRVFAQLSELGEKEMPGGLKAACFTLANATDAFDRRIEGGLDEQEIAQVGRLIGMIEAADGPENLLGELRTIFSGDSPEEDVQAKATLAQVARISGDLSAVLKPNGAAVN